MAPLPLKLRTFWSPAVNSSHPSTPSPIFPTDPKLINIVEGDGLREVSATKMALAKGAGTDDDWYDASTEFERAYLHSINIEKFKTANIELFDVSDDEDKTEEGGEKFP